MWRSASESKPVHSRYSRLSQGWRTAKPIRIISAVSNWFRRRTSHELNSWNSIRLMWSTASEPGLKDLARQGLISFTKHKRPISSKDLEVLYAANQLGLNPPESFANSAWFINTILYFGKRGHENQREMKPGALQLNNNNKPAEVLHLKRESDENQSTFKCSRFYTFCVSWL